MARNPRTQTKTTVTPNFRPVDTFVQPAPLDTTRIRELDAFVGNLVPRIKRYAQVEQGRRDKKDVIAAEKAFAKITDKLLSYDEQVKKGNIPPDQSPMFRFAFNQSQGSQLGLNFIQQASEAYMKSNLPSATSSAGFNKWFDGYKADYMENNKGLLDLMGSFDAFDGYARQAQQNLLSSHLASVKKNFTTSASESAILQAERAIDAAETLIDNQIRVAELSDPAMRKELGRNLAIAAAQEITKANNDIVKSSSNFIKYPKQNKKVIDAVITKYVSLADLKMDDDDSKYISQLKTTLQNIKTRDGQSLYDTAYGEGEFFKGARLIRDNFIRRTNEQDAQLKIVRENTETSLINTLYKELSDLNLDEVNQKDIIALVQSNEELMKDINEYGIGNWENIVLKEFNDLKKNSEIPMTEVEKAKYHRILFRRSFDDPEQNLKVALNFAHQYIENGELRGQFAIEIINKLETRLQSLRKEKIDLGRAEAEKRSDFYRDTSFKNVTRLFETEDQSIFGKLAKKLNSNPNQVFRDYNEFKVKFSDIYHNVDGNGERTWFKKSQTDRETEVQELFDEIVAKGITLDEITVLNPNRTTNNNSGVTVNSSTGNTFIQVNPPQN